ncbi:hypothetical protein PoB_001578400, partial [Plakobranchus ocellatus]
EAETESETAEDVPLAPYEETSEPEKAMEALAAMTSVETSAQDFVSIDSNVETTAEVSVSEIVQTLHSQNEPESDTDEEPQIEETEKKVTPGEARAAIATLRRFAEQQEKGDSLFNSLGVIEDKVEEISSANLKQKTLLDFFRRV